MKHFLGAAAVALAVVAASQNAAEADVPPLNEAVLVGNLIEAKVIVKHSAAEHDTPLHMAKLLIAEGADLNAKNYDGDTPLDMAMDGGNSDMKKFLIDHW